MVSEEVLLEKIKVLPPDLMQKAIEFVESLQKEAQKKTPRVSLKGIWADMDVNITEEDIREARNEMWRGYTKDTEDEK
ncbi:hypothetical protein BH10ACI1_BH10ACI1_31180 [soil metagenome]